MKFKILGLLTLCGALVLPVLGQGRGPGRGGPRAERFGQTEGNGGPQGRDGLDRLTEALELTPAQVASLEVLFEQRQSVRESFRGQLRANHEALQAAIASGDPTAVGNAVLAGEDVKEQAKAAGEDFKTQFRNQLTIDQQNRLDAIEAMGRGGHRGRGRGRFGLEGASQGGSDFGPGGGPRGGGDFGPGRGPRRGGDFAPLPSAQ